MRMSQIEIFRLKDDGSQEVLATGTLSENNMVHFEGDERFIKQLTTNGVLDKSVHPPVKIFPNEGARFIEILKKNLHSGYITVYEKQINNQQ